MHKKMTLIFLSIVFLLCGCHKKNERMLRAEERYKDYPLHLLALANKPIDDNKNLDLSLINESVYGRTPLQLLVEAQYQNRQFKKRKSIKSFKSFIEHGADIHLLLEAEFRKKIDIITWCLNISDNAYLKVFMQNYNQMLPSMTEQGGNYLMLACYYENFSAVPLLLPYVKDINENLKLGQTALHYAVAYSAPYKTVKLLLDNGADGTMEDLKGRTPYNLYLYCHPEKYQSKTARLLREVSGKRF